jgi:hypothetical protein
MSFQIAPPHDQLRQVRAKPAWEGCTDANVLRQNASRLQQLSDIREA